MTLPDPLVTWNGELKESSVQRNFDALDKTTGVLIYLLVGSGSPNGVVTSSPPALYLNTTGGAGTTFYVKESGVNTNTGWVGK